jgi:SAM-dependent methyltransferase
MAPPSLALPELRLRGVRKLVGGDLARTGCDWQIDAMQSSETDARGESRDGFDARCALCGQDGRFLAGERPDRESYPCPSCRATLRYQGQARVILEHFSSLHAASIADLVRRPELRSLRVWEPGTSGYLSPHFKRLRHFERSAYWPDVRPGKRRRRVRCENLMATTFPSDHFDLIITSDVFEHVRKPELAFREVYRILHAGGAHVFSIPVLSPMSATTVERVDTSGTDDVLILEAVYHNTHIVYNDFGHDLVGRLDEIGFHTDVVAFESTSANAARLLTFRSVKPRPA